MKDFITKRLEKMALYVLSNKIFISLFLSLIVLTYFLDIKYITIFRYFIIITMLFELIGNNRIKIKYSTL